MKTYKLKINGREYDVTVQNADGRRAEVTVNGTDYHVDIEECVNTERMPQETAASAPLERKETAGSGCHDITSPLPGIVVEICVSKGDDVKAGQKVAVIEAMKMENDIVSESTGKVGEIKVSKGDSVPEGAVIMTIINQ